MWKSKIKRILKQKTHFTKTKGLRKRYRFFCGVKKGFYTFNPRQVTCKRCKKIMRARRKKYLKATKKSKLSKRALGVGL